MSWWNKLRGRSSSTADKAPADDVPVCAHVTLVARWDAAADMGDDAKASSWTCDACGTSFSPGEAETLRATEAERLKNALRSD
ncbi:MAG: hypothetical protein M3P30_11550 [Chloroflexota bacterium]|nr:hypothetical protein [Chloroflexota bacterium]